MRRVNLKDFTKLKGLMAMSNSDVDNEALQAIRAANRLLIANGMTWELIFSRTVRVINEVEEAPHRDDDLAASFDLALRNATGTFRQTLESIREQYEARGWISPKQRAMVENAAERVVDRHPGGRIR